MLAFFTVKRTFCKLTLTLTVDCERKAADLTVTYDRRIMRMDKVEFWRVSDLDRANAYLGQDMGETGNLLESLERGYRMGYLKPAPAPEPPPAQPSPAVLLRRLLEAVETVERLPLGAGYNGAQVAALKQTAQTMRAELARA